MNRYALSGKAQDGCRLQSDYVVLQGQQSKNEGTLHLQFSITSYDIFFDLEQPVEKLSVIEKWRGFEACPVGPVEMVLGVMKLSGSKPANHNSVSGCIIIQTEVETANDDWQNKATKFLDHM